MCYKPVCGIGNSCIEVVCGGIQALIFNALKSNLKG